MSSKNCSVCSLILGIVGNRGLVTQDTNVLYGQLMRRCMVVFSALVLMVAFLGADQASAATRLAIEVVSNRADLISGGDALVRVTAPTNAGPVRVEAGGRDVTAAFHRQPDRPPPGPVQGLADRPSTLTATQPV